MNSCRIYDERNVIQTLIPRQ